MKSVVIIEFCLTGKDFLKMEKKIDVFRYHTVISKVQVWHMHIQ